MDAESEDVMEDSLDEIDEEGTTQQVLKIVHVSCTSCGDYSKVMLVHLPSGIF